jgi:hypothetical protein
MAALQIIIFVNAIPSSPRGFAHAPIMTPDERRALKKPGSLRARRDTTDASFPHNSFRLAALFHRRA